MAKNQTEQRIEIALDDIDCLSTLSFLTEIPGDLSPRRYYRCQLTEVCPYFSDTIVAMVFDSIVPPESESKLVYTSDVAVIELSIFFEKNNIPVPKIYLDRRDIGIILLEDLGNETLINVLKNDPPTAIEYYRKACDIIKSIQNIPVDRSYFAFNRALEEEVFKRETESFRKYFLDLSSDENHRRQLENCLDLVCEEVASFVPVLCHRDFHSWNLMIDKGKNLRVIDFQDALMGPRTYDLVALLHERDIDFILTNEQILELEDEYFKYYKDPKVREYEYPRVQLQRDIKTTGLFRKCVIERGLPAYGRWIPGNLKRMKCTLSNLSSSDVRYRILFEYITELGKS